VFEAALEDSQEENPPGEQPIRREVTGINPSIGRQGETINEFIVEGTGLEGANQIRFFAVNRTSELGRARDLTSASVTSILDKSIRVSQIETGDSGGSKKWRLEIEDTSPLGLRFFEVTGVVPSTGQRWVIRETKFLFEVVRPGNPPLVVPVRPPRGIVNRF